MSDTTPLMLQYNKIKEQHPDEVLFFRLGDFYEMFNSDAVEVSRLLNLTLTKRQDTPMCGVPYHASKIYIARLLRLGKRIAVCEQVSEPAQGKGLTERKVVEIITPGNALEEEYLDGAVNNFLASVCLCGAKKNFVSFSYIDISTGAFYATSWSADHLDEELSKEVGRVRPREIIAAQSLENIRCAVRILQDNSSAAVTYYPDWHFQQELSYKRLTAQFGTVNLRSFSLTEESNEIPAAGFLLEYITKTSHTSLQHNKIPHVSGITVYKDSAFMSIDDSSRRNLEIYGNLRDGSIQYSLRETLQYTVTPMGTRLLNMWLMMPLKDAGQIKKRQQSIGDFLSRRPVLTQVRALLSKILDVERLAGRIAMEKAHAKDLLALKTSLQARNDVRIIIDEFDPCCALDTAPACEIISLIEKSIIDDPSVIFTEGRLIRENWSAELDHVRAVQSNFSAILDEYAQEERESSGISNLKIRYNRLTGYYIEITRGKLDAVPGHFILRRSLVNGDRYTTQRLQELEHELLGAGEKIVELEKKLFFEIRTRIAGHIRYLIEAAAEIAYVDASSSLAYAAGLHGWVCPDVDDSTDLEITDGRHPVVEYHQRSGEFVPNDTNLTDKKFALITGPNMAGKSTYLRQNALIVLLAQIGSYVPAKKAHIGIVDAVFCRVGASDNLARGESTFLVEMTETAHILRSATDRSLVIMDEVGRGTSTEDGLSIAWAVSEYLLHNIKAKTLFATHYHELTRLIHPSLQLLCLDVLEADGTIIFLKKIKEGASGSSYGLHAASLAGIPGCIVERASEILENLQKNAQHTELDGTVFCIPQTAASSYSPEGFTAPHSPDHKTVPGLFSDEELVLDEILSLDPDCITPLEALQRIARWKKNLSGRS